MALTLRNYTFIGEGPIMVLNFLRRFCDEANTLNMSEAQAYVALSYFLRGFALDQFQTVKDAYAASEGGVTCWPEAVQYLIRSYATSTAIREAIISLRDIQQKPTESEMEYSARLNQVEFRCGNVHPIAEKITMFISGLNPAIEPLITRVREENPSRSYLELVQIARDHGDAFRARGGNAKATPLAEGKPTVGTRNTRSSALLASSADDLWGHEGLHPAFEGNVDPLQMMTEAEDSMPTTDLPSTESEISHLQEMDPMLAMGYRTVPAPRLAFQRESSSADNRPGWQDRRGQAQNPRVGLICHACYEKNSHVQPKSALPMKEIWRVVQNHESLTQEEKARVPTISYYRAKMQFTTDGQPIVPRPHETERASVHPFPQLTERHRGC